jgi:hypothetical protein
MKALNKLLNQEGRIIRWPTKPKEKTLVIEYLATKFSQDEDYSEQDVNEVLKRWHTFSDWALLRATGARKKVSRFLMSMLI